MGRHHDVDSKPHEQMQAAYRKAVAYFDFDTPHDLRHQSLARTSLGDPKAAARTAAKKSRPGQSRAGTGFGVKRIKKPQCRVSSNANRLEQSDADAWAQALNSLIEEKPVEVRSAASDRRSLTVSTLSVSSDSTAFTYHPTVASPPTGPQPARPAGLKRKRKPDALNVKIRPPNPPEVKCKKHIGRRDITWSRDEGGDVIMCSCTDLSHVL